MPYRPAWWDSMYRADTSAFGKERIVRIAAAMSALPDDELTDMLEYRVLQREPDNPQVYEWRNETDSTFKLFLYAMGTDPSLEPRVAASVAALFDKACTRLQNGYKETKRDLVAVYYLALLAHGISPEIAEQGIKPAAIALTHEPAYAAPSRGVRLEVRRELYNVRLETLAKGDPPADWSALWKSRSPNIWDQGYIGLAYLDPEAAWTELPRYVRRVNRWRRNRRLWTPEPIWDLRVQYGEGEAGLAAFEDDLTQRYPDLAGEVRSWFTGPESLVFFEE